MSTPDLHSLMRALEQFAAERDWDPFHSPKNLAMALSVEVAELVEHFQWLSEDQSRNPGKDAMPAIEDEVADVLLYLLQMCNKLGIDPMMVADRKLAKNALKYPIEDTKGKAKRLS